MEKESYIAGYADPDVILKKKRKLWLEELHEFQQCSTFEELNEHFKKWQDII